MAKTKPVACDNVKQMEQSKFRKDDNNCIEVAVTDSDVSNKLDTLISSTGGTTNTNVTTFNISVGANAEVSQALPIDTKRFIIRSRNRGKIRLSYASGGTSSSYLTLEVGTSYEDTSFYSAKTIYFQSSKPGDVIEIVTFHA